MPVRRATSGGDTYGYGFSAETPERKKPNVFTAWFRAPFLRKKRSGRRLTARSFRRKGRKNENTQNV